MPLHTLMAINCQRISPPGILVNAWTCWAQHRSMA